MKCFVSCLIFFLILSGLLPCQAQTADLTGIDLVQKGMMQQDYVARGMNDVFTGKMRTFTDNRIAGLPSLRANVSYLMRLAYGF